MTNLCSFSHTKALESNSALTAHLCSYGDISNTNHMCIVAAILDGTTLGDSVSSLLFSLCAHESLVLEMFLLPLFICLQREHVFT